MTAFKRTPAPSSGGWPARPAPTARARASNKRLLAWRAAYHHHPIIIGHTIDYWEGVGLTLHYIVIDFRRIEVGYRGSGIELQIYYT